MASSSENNDETQTKMDKTSGYVRTVVAIHNIRDKYKEAVESLQDKSLAERVHEGWDKTRETVSTRTRNFFTHPDDVTCEYIPPQFGYIFRPKSRWELVLLSGTVCGIEFCYAAETAFVTPILLSLGLKIKFVTMIWCLSPLIGFFLTPVLGSLSDTCDSNFGRRRPFILMLSMGILIGLILVPNGRHIGAAMGDIPRRRVHLNDSVLKSEAYTDTIMLKNATQSLGTANKFIIDNAKRNFMTNITEFSEHKEDIHEVLTNYSENVSQIVKDSSSPVYLNRKKRFAGKGHVQSAKKVPMRSRPHLQPWSIAFTVIGTILLDFCSDACQSPSRTYLLDVSIHEDHNAGLSTFTVMAGLGGSIGYLTGAIHWENTYLGNLLGGQINAVFMLVSIVFVICLIATLKSFPEIPLPLLKDPKLFNEYQEKLQYQEKGNEMTVMDNKILNYGSTSTNDEVSQAEEPTPNGIVNDGADIPQVQVTEEDDQNAEGQKPPAVPIILTEPKIPVTEGEPATLQEYLRSIVHMPKSLRILCLTNLFCWMSLVCYSLYFTDFVGEVVYGGDPQSPEGSYLNQLYKDGVSFGCWGMALYSLSCSIYSCFIESLVLKLGAKRVYIGGQLVYSVGMIIMAAARHPAAVILLSPTAGVMYSTLFTMPYLLIAHYHCMQKFRDDFSGGECGIRGIGTDVASVSSMVFLSQFILSLTMGSIVEAVGSNVVPVCAAAVLSACGAVCATRVMYLDM